MKYRPVRELTKAIWPSRVGCAAAGRSRGLETGQSATSETATGSRANVRRAMVAICPGYSATTRAERCSTTGGARASSSFVSTQRAVLHVEPSVLEVEVALNPVHHLVVDPADAAELDNRLP